jgi:hypothetical protein
LLAESGNAHTKIIIPHHWGKNFLCSLLKASSWCRDDVHLLSVWVLGIVDFFAPKFLHAHILINQKKMRGVLNTVTVVVYVQVSLSLELCLRNSTHFVSPGLQAPNSLIKGDWQIIWLSLPNSMAWKLSRDLGELIILLSHFSRVIVFHCLLSSDLKTVVSYICLLLLT